jgi:hypothetical protein
LKQLPASAAEAVGIGATQSAIGAGINQAYGLGEQSPWEAAKESVPSMLGLTAVMSPLGLAGRALSVRGAKQRADFLSDPSTNPEVRDTIATQYYKTLLKTDPEAAEQFQKNAKEAIKQGAPLPVDPTVFSKLDIPDTGALSQDVINRQNQERAAVALPLMPDKMIPGQPIDPAKAAAAEANAARVTQMRNDEDARKNMLRQHESVVADLNAAGIEPSKAMSFPEFAEKARKYAEASGQPLDEATLYRMFRAHQDDVMSDNFAKKMALAPDESALGTPPKDYVEPGQQVAGVPTKFGQMSEFADLLKSETADVAAKRAAAQAAAEKAKAEQKAAVENYTKAAVADTDARVAGSEAQKAEAKRRGVVSDVLNDEAVPVERKAAAIRTALRKAGESVKLTDEEKAVIQKHADVSHAFTTEWEKPLESAPNEMDVYGDKAIADEREAKAQKAVQAAKDSAQVGKLQPGMEKQLVAALSLPTPEERATAISELRSKQKNEKSNAFAILDTIDRQLNPKEPEHAVPVEAAGKMDVRQEAGNGERVGGGNAKSEKPTAEGGQGDASGAEVKVSKGGKRGTETAETKQVEPQAASEAVAKGSAEPAPAAAAAAAPVLKGQGLRSIGELWAAVKPNVPEIPTVEPGAEKARTRGRPVGTTDERHTPAKEPIDPATDKVVPSASWAYTHTLEQAKGLTKNIWWQDLAWAAANKDIRGAADDRLQQALADPASKPGTIKRLKEELATAKRNEAVAREILENGKFTDDQLARAPAEAAKIESVNAEIAKMGENTQRVGEEKKPTEAPKLSEDQLNSPVKSLTPEEYQRKQQADAIVTRRKAAQGDKDAQKRLAEQRRQREADRAGEEVDDYSSWRSEHDFGERTLDSGEAGFEHRAELEAREEPHILDALTGAKSVNDLLTRMRNGATASQKVLIAALRHFNLGTKFEYVDSILHTDDGRVRDGFYHPGTDTMTISKGGATTETVLHELMHAATATKVEQAMGLYKTAMTLGRDGIAKLSPEERGHVESLWNLFSVYHDAQEAAKAKGVEGQYGLSNIHDFLAETFSNKEFQKFLQTGGEKTSMWGRFVATVKSMLGIQGPDTMLSKAMDAGSRLMSTETGASDGLNHVAKNFESTSPTKNTGAVDTVLSALPKLAQRLSDKLHDTTMAGVSRDVFGKMLGWETVGYIAHNVETNPALGHMIKPIQALQSAYDTLRQATQRVEDKSSKYARAVELELHKLGPDARKYSNIMMSMAGEQSRIGMVFDKTYDEQVKADPKLAGVDKTYFDQMRQQWLALERTHPALVKAVREGAEINRERFVNKAASITANLIRSDKLGYLTSHLPDLDFMSQAPEQIRKTLDKVFADATALPPESQVKDRIGALAELFSNQVDNPYYHLGRDGNYFFRTKFSDLDKATYDKVQEALQGSNKVLGDMDAMVKHGLFMRFNTMEEAQGFRNKVLAASNGKLDLNETRSGALIDKGLLTRDAGLSPAMYSILDALHEQMGDHPALRELITREFMSMLPETSAKKSLMQRRGVPAYDGDFLKNFSTRAAGDVQSLGHIYSSHLFNDAFRDMRGAVETLQLGSGLPASERAHILPGDAASHESINSGDAGVRAAMVHKELQDRFNNGMTPVDGSMISKINSIGHTFYLALSPAFLLRTTMQPYHRTLPILGSKYGFTKSAVEIGKATGVAFQILKKSIAEGVGEGGARGVLDAEMKFNDLGLSKKEEAFIQELHDRGELNLGQTRQLARMAMGQDLRSNDFTRFASMTAQYAEMSNRIVAALAAFRMAEKNEKPKPGESTEALTKRNTEYGITSSKNSMDTFESDQTARQIGKHGFAGSVTPLLTSFMNYNLQTMQQISRAVHDGMFSKDPSPEGLQRAKEARKEFAGLMGTTAVLAGGLGLPFANVFAGLYNNFANEFNTTDSPSDIKIDIQNFLSDVFGQGVGEMLSHGVARGVGVDLSTAGLQNLMPGTEFLDNRRMFKDRMATQAEQLMGPALNVFVGAGAALSKISDGYYMKGLEAAMPSGLKAYYKAAALATVGYTDSKGNPMPITATPWDVLVQSTGFTPAKKATAMEAQDYMSTNAELIAHRKDVLSDRFYKGVKSGDQGDITGAVQGISNFNQVNPYDAMRDLKGVFQEHALRMATGQVSGTGVGVDSKRQFPKLQQVRFSGAGMQ